MELKGNVICLVCFFYIICVITTVSAKRVAPEPIINGGVYKLENQQDGACLAASAQGEVNGGEYSGSPGQKWTFSEQGPNIYTITSLANEKNAVSSQQWELISIGPHGKRMLKNTQTGQCIQNSGRGRPVQEKECSRDNTNQRWKLETVK